MSRYPSIVAGVGLMTFIMLASLAFVYDVTERKDHNYEEFCEAKHLIAIHTHDGWYCVQGESI
jgi:hypothetical protein